MVGFDTPAGVCVCQTVVPGSGRATTTGAGVCGYDSLFLPLTPNTKTPDEHVRFIIRVGQLMDIREFNPRMCLDPGARESDKERQQEMYQRIQRLCKRFVLIALVHARIDGPCYGLPPSAA